MTIPAVKKNPLLTEVPMQLLLAVLGALLLSWPIIQVAGSSGTVAWAEYVFSTWAGIILVLMAVGRALSQLAAPQTGNAESSKEDVV